VSKNTYTRYACSLTQLAPWFETTSANPDIPPKSKKLSQVNKALVGEIVDARSLEVTTATIKRDLVALSSVMQYAVDRDWCEANPVLPWMKRLHERRDPIVEPRDQDIELMIQHARGMWPYLIRAARLTGVREQALVLSKRDAINHERKEYSVLDKGSKFRVIELSADDYRFFTSIPAFAGKDWLFWRTENKRVRKDSKRAATEIGDQIEDPGPIFARETKRVVKWAAKNGVDFRPFTFHHLRHKHAIVYMREGGNIYDLQKRLGHSTVKQTEEYLKFLTPEQQRIATQSRRDVSRRAAEA
jgi:integrase/recombinase XerD